MSNGAPVYVMLKGVGETAGCRKPRCRHNSHNNMWNHAMGLNNNTKHIIILLY